MNVAESFRVLGIPADSDPSVIRAAWRQKASTLHPDAGGNHDDMVLLNQALSVALVSVSEEVPPTASQQPRQQQSRKTQSFVSRDVSCFTIEALPVDAWQLLAVGAQHCGPVISVEEPYLLEFMLSDTGVTELIDVMCRCEIVPEAGGSTVHVSLFSEIRSQCSVEAVRDILVDAINELS